MCTPVKNRFNSISISLEHAHVKATLLQKELDELRVLHTTPKATRRGITVDALETHVFSTEEVLEKVRLVEEARKAKQGHWRCGRGIQR